VNEGIILRAVDECEMSRGFLINPLLSRHLGGLKENVEFWLSMLDTEKKVDGSGTILRQRGVLEISSLRDLPPVHARLSTPPAIFTYNYKYNTLDSTFKESID